MRTDAAETRRAILEAATAEFSRHGLAGSRVDRIAAEAGCSKERLYANFGDKRSLFTTVLNGTFETMGDAASCR
jgi:AcrR family transcriptional regulator